MGRWPLVVLIALVAGVISGSIVFSIREDSSGSGNAGDTIASAEREAPLTGPDVPPAGALPGRIWAASSSPGDHRTRSCNIGQVDLSAGLEVITDRIPACLHLSISPNGAAAVALDPARGLTLVSLDAAPVVVADLAGLPAGFHGGRVVVPIAWSPDSARVAWCFWGVETTVYILEHSDRSASPGCDPRFATDGALLARVTDFAGIPILREGQSILDEADLQTALGRDESTRVQLFAYDTSAAHDGREVVALVRRLTGPRQPIVIRWRADSDEAVGVYELRGMERADRIVVSPDGQWAAVGNMVGTFRDLFGMSVAVDLKSGALIPLPEGTGYAWSPDSRWLAVAQGDSVGVYSSGGGGPSYVLPLAAELVAWTP